MVDVLTSGLLGLFSASDVHMGIVCAATSALDAVTFYVMLEATVVPLWMTIAGRSAGGFADPLWRSCRPLR